jgi:hypothetical protein
MVVVEAFPEEQRSEVRPGKHTLEISGVRQESVGARLIVQWLRGVRCGL